MIAALCATTTGCGRGSKREASQVTPQQVESAFSRQGIQLIDTLVYTDRDQPIIRSYVIPGNGTKLNGSVLVYDSAHDAAAAEPGYRKLYGTGRFVAHANVIAQFTRDATKAAKRKITSVLDAMP